MKKNVTKKIIDVRRPEEFEKGHAKGSINISLQEIEKRLEEIKEITQPIVVVCGGGTRNVKAFELLKSLGVESEAGGSWKSV